MLSTCSLLIAIQLSGLETILGIAHSYVTNSCMNHPPSLHVPHFCWHRAYFPGTLGELKSLIFSHHDVNNILQLLESLFTRTQKTHFKVWVGTSHCTRSLSRLMVLLWLPRVWGAPGAQLGAVATLLSYPQILPQAMTMCQWLLRMWWEWELQEHVQHKPSVSQILL